MLKSPLCIYDIVSETKQSHFIYTCRKLCGSSLDDRSELFQLSPNVEAIEKGPRLAHAQREAQSRFILKYTSIKHIVSNKHIPFSALLQPVPINMILPSLAFIRTPQLIQLLVYDNSQ